MIHAEQRVEEPGQPNALEDAGGPADPTDRSKDQLVRGRSGIAGPGFCGAGGSGAELGLSPQNSRRDQPCCYGSGRWESC